MCLETLGWAVVVVGDALQLVESSCRPVRRAAAVVAFERVGGGDNVRRYWHRKDDNIVILEHIFLYALMLVLTFSHLGDGWIIQLVGEGHISRPFKALFIMLLLSPLFLSIFGQKDIFLRLLFSNGTNLPLLFSQYGILFHSQWIRLFATITRPCTECNNFRKTGDNHYG